MTNMEQIVKFIRANAQYGGVAIKSAGYTAATLPKEWIESKTDEQIASYMVQEIRTFDRHMAAIKSGGIVTVYVIQLQVFNVLHCQAYDYNGSEFKWGIVR